MPELDALQVATRRYIRDDPTLVDNVFQADPLLAYLRLNTKTDYDGGYRIDEPFWYKSSNVGSYLKGKEFDITEKQVEQSAQFNLKYFEANVTLGLEEIRVENAGRARVFSIVKSRMANAFTSMGMAIAIQLYLNGQRAGYLSFINGLAESLNNGTAVSWDNNTYPLYGTLTRNSTIGASMNSTPINVNGALSYQILSSSHASASYGTITPNIGITTPIGLGYIKNRFQPQQRFEEVNVDIGFRGIKFEGAMLMASRYCPGSYLFGPNNDGLGDAEVNAMLAESSNGVITAYPTPLVAGSESLFWINARKPWLNFYVAKDPMFGFGFTGFKWSPGNTKVSGQTLAGVQFTANPRYHTQVFGFTS